MLTKVEILKKNLKQASELLAKAKFSLNSLKPQIGVSVLPKIGIEKRDKVHEESLEYLGIECMHVEGLLRAELGQFELALESHAHEIIAASRLYDLAEISSPGYFQIANIHFKQNKLGLATSFYTKCCELWIESKDSRDLNFVEKSRAIKMLKKVVDMYAGMNENVRNREETLTKAEIALRKVERL